MLRRIILLCGALLVGVIVLSGVALAENIRGTFKQDELTGTNQLDRISYVDNQDIVKQNCENIWEAQAQ